MTMISSWLSAMTTPGNISIGATVTEVMGGGSSSAPHLHGNYSEGFNAKGN